MLGLHSCSAQRELTARRTILGLGDLTEQRGFVEVHEFARLDQPRNFAV